MTPKTNKKILRYLASSDREMVDLGITLLKSNQYKHDEIESIMTYVIYNRSLSLSEGKIPYYTLSKLQILYDKRGTTEDNKDALD